MAPQFDCGICCERLVVLPCANKGSHEIWYSPITKRNFPVAVGIASRHAANAVLRQAGLPKAF
jgi:hypothetical protein